MSAEPHKRRRRGPVDPEHHRTVLNWLGDRAFRALIAVMLALPYETRVRATGWIMRRIVGPLAGYRGRALANLAHVWPDLPPERHRQIADGALDNAGRTLIENYSVADQHARVGDWSLSGDGLTDATAARDAGRPVLFVGGHLANYQVACTVLNSRGFSLGGLYRPMNNPYINDHYVATIEAMGGPAFPRNSKGLTGFLRHVRGGGQGAILIDQFYSGGPRMDFLGQPAPTTTSAGDIALKYGAEIYPFYARRHVNGIDFDVIVEARVTGDTPESITQTLTDSLSARVRETPEQWFWLHRRWKPEKQRRLAAMRAAEHADADDTGKLP